MEKLKLKDLSHGVAKSQKEIREIIEFASERREFFIGTIIGDAINSFEVITEISEEKEFFVNANYATYDFNGNSNRDIELYELEDDESEKILCISLHYGADIRAGYTKYIILESDFEEFSLACSEEISSFYEEFEGEDWSITGNALTDELSVYNHNTDESYESYEQIYCHDEKEFEQECIKIIKSIKEENNL